MANKLLKNMSVPDQTDENEVTSLINRYSFIHAAVAFVLGPFAGPFLTPITIKMICDIGKHCNVETSKQKITNLFSSYAGLILGVSLAYGIGGLIPAIGNLSNAISSFVVTQIIGRASFKLFTSNSPFKFEELKEEDWSKIIGNIFRTMKDEDKKKLADLLVKLFNGKIDEVKNQIKEIFLSYKQDILERYKLTEDDLKKKFWEYSSESNKFKKELDNLTNSEKFKTLYNKMTDNDKSKCSKCMQIIFGQKSNYDKKERLNAQIEMTNILERYSIKYLIIDNISRYRYDLFIKLKIFARKGFLFCTN